MLNRWGFNGNFLSNPHRARALILIDRFCFVCDNLIIVFFCFRMDATQTYARFIPRFEQVVNANHWNPNKSSKWLSRPDIWRKLMSYYIKLDRASETRRSYLNALRQLALHHGMVPGCAFDQELLRHTLSLTREFRDREAKNQPDETDGHVFTPDELQSMMDDLTHEIEAPIKQYKIGSRSVSMDSTRYQLHQQRILLGMYLYHPVLRQNYGHVQLWDTDKSPNYIIKSKSSPSGAMVHIGHDKVSSKYGAAVFPLDERILGFLDDLHDAFPSDPPREWLLTQRYNRTLPLVPSPNSLQSESARKLLASIKLNGEPSGLNVCQLRVTAASEFYQSPKSQEEERQMASAMRTSTGVMRQSYHKLDRPSDPSASCSLDTLLKKRKH